MKNSLKITLFFILFINYSINAQNYCNATPVSVHGDLSINGNTITNKNNDPVSFAGNSLFWSNNGWGGEKFYTEGVVTWLKNDWNSTIIRAAMGVEDSGGYISNPTENKNKVKKIVDAAIKEGLYVIIDWHSHHAEDYQQEAITFFKEMATLYGNTPNVIYEIYNEPLQVSWNNTIKPYAEAVISEIRKIDPDNLIIVGTPTWSQDVDAASNNPITAFSNIAYTLHFYAATHKESLRQKAQTALNNGIAIMVTEWGAVSADGNGAVDSNSTDSWMKFLDQNNITHANWALNDKNEGASSLKPGASVNGNWSDTNLTSSGTKVKNIIKNWKNYCSEGNTDGEEPDGEEPDGEIPSTHNINIKAKGVIGNEILNIYLNNTLTKTLNLTANFKEYGISGTGELKVEFINDNGTRDVQVDYVIIDDLKLEAEEQKVNTGVWQNDTCGGSYSEWLNCNGYIIFNSTSDTGGNENGGGNEENNTCQNIKPWSASFVYDTAKTKIEYNGNIYENNWYTKNQSPETNSGQYQVWKLVSTCSKQNTTQKDIIISPNPATNELIINNNDYNNVEIYNVNGKRVLKQSINEKTEKVNVSTLNNGLYIIKLSGKTTISKTIIIKK